MFCFGKILLRSRIDDIERHRMSTNSYIQFVYEGHMYYINVM